MQERHVINPSYYCTRDKPDGVISVSNNLAYIVAEYTEQTGSVKWLRVIPAEQRNALEKWLGLHFRAGKAPEKTPV
jgi:hypothetical protein